MSEQGAGPSVESVSSRLQMADDGGFKHFRQIFKHMKPREAVAEWGIGAFSPTSKKGRTASRLRKCASHLVFRHWFESKETKLKSANFCELFILCTYCAARRAARYISKTLDGLVAVAEEHGRLRFIHMVLSNENLPSCANAVQALIEAKSRLLEKIRNAKKGRCSSAFEGVLGGLICIEIKKGKNSREWHPHIHAILVTSPGPGGKMDQNKAWDEWRAATRTPNVALPFLKEIKQDKDNDIMAALLEVLKYAVKPGSCTPEEQWEAHQAVNGKHRLIETFGCLRGIKVSSKELADDMDQDGPYVDWFLKFVKYKGYVVEHNSGVCCYGKHGVPER